MDKQSWTRVKGTSPDTLFDELEWILLAHSDNPVHPHLSGINFETEGTHRIGVSTDGRRCHFDYFPLSSDLPPDGNYSILSQSKKIITLVPNDRQFPNWRKVIPSLAEMESDIETVIPLITYPDFTSTSAKKQDNLGRAFFFAGRVTGALFDLRYFSALEKNKWKLIRRHVTGTHGISEDGQPIPESSRQVHEWISLNNRHCIIIPKNLA